METTKQQRLATVGFKVGSAAGFLSLTPDEEAMVEQRLASIKEPQQVESGDGKRDEQLNISQIVLWRKEVIFRLTLRAQV